MAAGIFLPGETPGSFLFVAGEVLIPSHRIYLLMSLKRSTSPEKYQLIFYY